jgi:hypothetical protein
MSLRVASRVELLSDHSLPHVGKGLDSNGEIPEQGRTLLAADVAARMQFSWVDTLVTRLSASS